MNGYAKRHVVRWLSMSALFGTLLVAPPTRADSIFLCHPYNIMDWSTTMVVTCSNSIVLNGQTINQVAVNVTTAPAAYVSRFVSFATAAMMSDAQYLTCWIPAVGTTFGTCNASSCRQANTSGLGQ
jgi:hypothetical protein